MIDLHCHILPGLDDGAKSFEEALEMARIAEKDGIEIIVATPHMFREGYVYDDFKEIEDQITKLNHVLRENTVNVKILKGAEVHISHNLIEEIQKNRENLVLNESSYMFVEFPSDHVFRDVKNLFFELMGEGITPIITHPERNSVFSHNTSLLFELTQMGGLIQVNSGSFLGFYGSRAREAVHYFLELNLIHFIASDGHNTKAIAPRLSGAVREVSSRVGEEKANVLVKDNPLAVLEDRELPDFFDPIDPREKEKSLKIKLPDIFGRKK
jgi:protein-tyrosine phosphatase